MLRAVGALALLSGQAASLVIQSQNLVIEHDQWFMIGRFCFDAQGGELAMKATNVPGFEAQQVAFYADLPETGFASVYKTGNSCKTKLARAHQFINISTPIFQSNTGKVYDITGGRPRWWYVVLANCFGESIQLQSLEISFTNAGGKYTKHFSKDEEGIFETQIVTILALIVEILLLLYSIKTRKAGTRTHHVLVVVLAAVGISTLSVFLQLVERTSFSSDGIGNPGLRDFCTFLDVFPNLLLVGLFVWISKGWQISNQRPRDARACGEALVLYLATNIAVVWWSLNPSDDDHVYLLSIYESAPGYILVFIRLVALAWFLSSLNVTWLTEKDVSKKTFYVAFGIFGGVWFLMLPIVVLVSTAMETWNRKKTVEVMQLLVLFITYFLFWVFFGLRAKDIQAIGDDHAGLGGGYEQGNRATGGMGASDGADVDEAAEMANIDADEDLTSV